MTDRPIYELTAEELHKQLARKAINEIEPLLTMDPYPIESFFHHAKGSAVMSKSTQQIEYKKAVDLITKIAINGGSNDELLRAIRYYRVVREAPVKKLDYKKAYKVLQIHEMVLRYR